MSRVFILWLSGSALYFVLALSAIPALASGAMSMPQNEDEINLYCLRQSYPQIGRLEKDADGKQWLYMKDGRRILYANGRGASGLSDLQRSLATSYALEPERPETPPGYAPGRVRDYDLLASLYGENAQKVRGNLVPVRYMGKTVNLAAPAAEAFARVAARLEALAARDSRLKSLLKPDGGFFWRKIAGENAQSAHSYGIALDLGASKAPYWRWSKTMPHPMQKSYPAEIVSAFEDEGFIWGGKWHEYDLMHFEYRPELICKAKMSRRQARQ